MKRKSKDVNIFSMSALDLFASAMGAFLLIAVMALPYYLNTNKSMFEEVQALKKQLSEIGEKLATCEQENQETRATLSQSEARNEEMRKKLSKTFAVVHMQWSSSNKEDVDMWIVDPNGRKYYHGKKSFPNVDGEFIIDVINKEKGDEVWLTSILKTGTYKVYYHYYGGGGAVNVTGKIFTKSFTKNLRNKRLTSPGSNSRQILVAEIKVNNDGDATLIQH